MCDLLLPTLIFNRGSSRQLITIDIIIRTKYDVVVGEVAVYDDRSQDIGEHLAAYLGQYGQILGDNSDNLNGEWGFNIMIDRLTFVPIPNCLNICCRKMLVIVTGRKPTC